MPKQPTKKAPAGYNPYPPVWSYHQVVPDDDQSMEVEQGLRVTGIDSSRVDPEKEKLLMGMSGGGEEDVRGCEEMRGGEGEMEDSEEAGMGGGPEQEEAPLFLADDETDHDAVQAYFAKAGKVNARAVSAMNSFTAVFLWWRIDLSKPGILTDLFFPPTSNATDIVWPVNVLHRIRHLAEGSPPNTRNAIIRELKVRFAEKKGTKLAFDDLTRVLDCIRRKHILLQPDLSEEQMEPNASTAG